MTSTGDRCRSMLPLRTRTPGAWFPGAAMGTQNQAQAHLHHADAITAGLACLGLALGTHVMCETGQGAVAFGDGSVAVAAIKSNRRRRDQNT